MNPLSQAKARGEQIVKLVDLGDDYVFAGFQIVPATNDVGELCAILVAVGGRNTVLAGVQPASAVVCELGKTAMHAIKAAFAAQLDPKSKEPEPPKLVVVPA